LVQAAPAEKRFKMGADILFFPAERGGDVFLGHGTPLCHIENCSFYVSARRGVSRLPKIGNLSKTAQIVFLLFNNCHLGQAVRNALWMQQALS